MSEEAFTRRGVASLRATSMAAVGRLATPSPPTLANAISHSYQTTAATLKPQPPQPPPLPPTRTAHIIHTSIHSHTRKKINEHTHTKNTHSIQAHTHQTTQRLVGTDAFNQQKTGPLPFLVSRSPRRFLPTQRSTHLLPSRNTHTHTPDGAHEQTHGLLLHVSRGTVSPRAGVAGAGSAANTACCLLTAPSTT